MKIFKVGRVKSPMSKVDLFTDLENIIFEKKEFYCILFVVILIAFVLGVIIGNMS